jgi:hypothetical protein
MSKTAADAGPQTALNQQIVDALTQLQAIGGEVGEVAGASLAQVIAQSAGLALLNAVAAQQNAQIVAGATTLATVTRILALRSADEAPA